MVMSIQNLFSASIGLALFICILILGKKNKKKADYILVIWLAVFIVNFISLFLLNVPGGDHQLWEQLMFEFSEASIFLHGPVLYFYTLALIKKSFVFRIRQLVHIVPFTITFAILLTGLLKSDGISEDIRNLLLVIKMLSLLLYLVVVLMKLYSHSNRVEDIFSNTEEKHLRWLTVLSWGILLVWFVAASSLLIHRYTAYSIPQYGGLLTNIAISIFVFVMGYYGINQPSIFFETYAIRNKETAFNREIFKNPDKTKYGKSGLTFEISRELAGQLSKLMQESKPYLEPELTLYTLAEKMQVLPNHLSQTINSIERKNFFDFINEYRVEEAKKNILSKEKHHLNLVGIAFESGFNSKSSFNRAFKKHVGCTPSQFKENNSN